MRIAKFESHKTLCRKLQDEICRMEDCEHCVVLFNDVETRQLFTIAYAEDDDFVSTAQNLIKMSEDKLRKLDKKTQASQIRQEVENIKQMKDDMNKESEVRNLMLTRNQMICIPHQVGSTGTAFA